MDNQKLIDSVVKKVKEAGYTPSSVSSPDDANVIVRFADTLAPHAAVSVVLTGEEIARYARSEPLGKADAKLELVARNHVRAAINRLKDIRPKEQAAAARKVAEGR